MAGWAGGVGACSACNVPTEPAKKALCRERMRLRTDAIPATLGKCGNVLSSNGLGVGLSADGVLFYLTAQGTGCARGFLQKHMKELSLHL